VPLAYAGQGMVMIINNALNALHHPILAATLSIVQMFLVYIPLAYVFSTLFGIKGIFVALVISFTIVAVYAHFLVNKQIKKST
jgi:Na+-driven multidrug efflux pump